MVKRIAAILAFMTYLMGATDANQLLKIPFMVDHFHSHQQKDPSLNIARFFYQHYMHPVMDSDHEQDMKLPFKTHQADGCMVSAISMPIHKIEIASPVMHLSSTTFTDEITDPYQFQPMVNIFQPPRIIAGVNFI